MKAIHRRHQGRSALELIEEATHLLRTAPAAALASYYLGSAPFVLGLLFFWADMSRNPFAPQHLTAAALGMAVLFLWMKFWQAVFARQLRALISAEPPPAWNYSRCRRLFVTQTVLQPWGLFLLPLALIPVLPFAWVYACFQNLTALSDGESPRLRTVIQQSVQQAVLWPRQNLLVLAILLAFSVCGLLNWMMLGFVLPGLVKMLLGVETIFTLSGSSLMNTTFFAAMFGLTYLSVDPIVKAVYVLRCFYGESLKSGEDLKAELKHYAAEPKAIAAGLVLLLGLVGAGSLGAAEATPPAAPGSGQQVSPGGIPPAELDGAIDKVINDSKYTWRLPREKKVEADAEQGVIARFLAGIGQTLKKWLRAALEWLDEILRKLFGRKHSSGSDSSGYGWIMMQQVLLYSLVAVVVIAIGFLLYRVLRDPKKRASAIRSEAIQPTPDLTDENIGADQLPEDEWTKLGRELLERGEFRLALRAFYLASLAHLATRNLVHLAKFKSNHDYERELHRRAHSFPALISAFGETVSVFDRVWYGLHEVNSDLVKQFAASVERIKTGG